MTPEEDQAAFSTQYDQQQAAEAQKADASKAPPTLGQRFAVPQAPVTTSMLDSIVAEAQNWGTAAKRVGQDAVAGATTGAVNIADAAGAAISTSGKEMAAEADPAHAAEAEAGTLPTSPIWDHAKAHILDFRDAVAVKDPNIVDRLTQGVAQLAVPFAGYSRVLSGLHGVANMVVAGGATDLTALAPHDMRTADVLSLGRQTEGKLGEVLRTLAPDGSAQNAYINFLADRGNESEALGRFKNVLDGFGVNLIATPLLSAVATTLKQGTAGLRYMVDNGVGSAGDFMPAGSRASQRGSVGVTNNASGESDASAEAQNWVKAQKSAGMARYRLDPDGKHTLLPGIDARDPRSVVGHPVIDMDKEGNATIVDRGDLTPAAAKGLIERAKQLHGLGQPEEK